MTLDEHLNHVKEQIEKHNSLGISKEDVRNHPSNGTVKIEADIKEAHGVFLNILREDGYVVSEVNHNHFYIHKIKLEEKEITKTVTKFVKDDSE